MTVRVALHHRTRYRYARGVALGPQVIRLRPAPHCRTPIASYSLRVEPGKHFTNWQQDPFGNWQARLVFPEATRELDIQVDLSAELTAINPFDFFLEPGWEEYGASYEGQLARDLAPYLVAPESGSRVDRLLADVPTSGIRTIDLLVDLNQRVQRMVRYTVRLEPGVQEPEETLIKASGSCRDSAWLLCACLRRLGIAARFASGYLVQLSADEKSLDGPSGPERDFTDLHAWTEAYLPGAGWVGLDPTSGLMAGEGHIPLACTPDPQSASPVSGGFAACEGDEEVETEFSFAMRVERIHEDPRSTRPYAEDDWQAILSAGEAVEARLRAGDVRLTSGGEPTFVSIDDYDGAEWNTAALGEGKRRLAGELIKRLRRRFAPGAALHYGHGKWYPGEQLPRWALNCYARRDGVPVWQDESLIADHERPPGHGREQAEAFIGDLAARLSLPADAAIPAFEDAFYYLWRERRLPVDTDPYDSRLDDPLERARLARVFSQGLDESVGWCLPLAPAGRGRWRSGRWFLRDERLRLTPGDSPMGLRLPLDSLPWARPEDRIQEPAPDPFAPRPPLAARRIRQLPGAAVKPAGAGAEPGTGFVRTALCVEARGGILHVFLPPLALLEDWIDLVAAVEDSARELAMPVVLEGYTPPKDQRLRSFSVTPDPGVIEVNVAPVSSWAEAVEQTTVLYEEARLCRLGAEKFELDGRVAGSGGGNHITFGGATPADSPFLRRPELLRSLIAYWHNHPALSYLFSGLFIGPTSQAPRADEARSETVYELESALRLLPRGEGSAPWLPDRVLRNLLVDLTGNTHRAEICIDKLFSPDHAAGRLGLVELRAFEMPPHPRMALVQQLLLRSLIARFWEEPYRAPLARWGTLLHDRWMLPRHLVADLDEVVGECGERGLPLDRRWFQPFAEFRFPKAGEIVHRGCRLELRHALEPWHVLGEEPGAGGTARYVDSSIERLQVLLQGATPGRHAVAVNGVRLPLQPTGQAGELVCGVRFRAWQPPSCLHPTVPVHAPLVFDLVDTWNGRAVAGCTYHVGHPGGRSFDTRPVNHPEAEGRRLARFWPHGHSPGPSTPREAGVDGDYPHTLDLRRCLPDG